MSKVQVDKVVNLSDDGAPQLTYGAELPVGYGLTGAGGINISGVCTAASFSGTSADFSGNVTIGGTLTYEDVTNIDVVGVSTFAGRMNVNSTIEANEGINVSAGIVTITDSTESNSATTGAVKIAGGLGVVKNLYTSGAAYVQGSGGLNVSYDVSIADKIVHTGDTNTALRFPSADTITAETGGTERLRVNSSGNVSIGDNPTVNSDTLLHVEKADEVNVVFEGNTTTLGARLVLKNNNTDTGAYNALEFSDAGGQSTSNIIGYNTDQTNNYGELAFQTRSAQGSPPAERLRITSAGKVGLGITNPDELLHIASTGTVKFKLTDKRTGIADGSQYGVIQFEQKDSNTPGVSVEMAAVMTDTSNGATALQFKTGTPSTIDERLRIDSSGRLLIGATASNQVWGLEGALQVEGLTGDTASANFISNQNSNAPFYLNFSKSRGTSDGSATVVQSGDYLGTIAFAGADGTDRECVGARVDCIVDGTPGSNDMPGRLMFSTTADGADTPTERMRLTSEGRLAIGSNQAHATLVARSADDTKQFAVQNSTSESGSFDNETGIWFKGQQSQDDERYKAAIIHLCTADYGVGDLVFCVDGAADNGNATIADNAKMRIQSDGGISFGSAGPVSSEVFTFQKSTANGGTSGQLMYIDHAGTDDHSCVQIRHRGASSTTFRTQISFLNDAGTEIGRIRSDGDETTYNTSSDYRLKENAVGITSAITRLKTLKPYRFNFKNTPSKTRDGFFAHEAATVVPEAVSGTKDKVITQAQVDDGTRKEDDLGKPEYQSMDYSKLVPLLTAALQESVDEIESLKTLIKNSSSFAALKSSL